jgi:hypothetical protein
MRAAAGVALIAMVVSGNHSGPARAPAKSAAMTAHPERAPLCSRALLKLVMPGLVPGIHVSAALEPGKTWMAGA